MVRDGGREVCNAALREGHYGKLNRDPVVGLQVMKVGWARSVLIVSRGACRISSIAH